MGAESLQVRLRASPGPCVTVGRSFELAPWHGLGRKEDRCQWYGSNTVGVWICYTIKCRRILGLGAFRPLFVLDLLHRLG